MKVSTKGRYGTRAMLALAGRYAERLVRATEIAAEQQISLKYLENILSALKTAGLVVSERGKNGGYALARPPSEISLYEVLVPLECSMSFVHCTGQDPDCQRMELCVTRSVWTELKEATDRILKGTSLEDLLQRQEEMVGELQRGEHAHEPSAPQHVSDVTGHPRAMCPTEAPLRGWHSPGSLTKT